MGDVEFEGEIELQGASLTRLAFSERIRGPWVVEPGLSRWAVKQSPVVPTDSLGVSGRDPRQCGPEIKHSCSISVGLQLTPGPWLELFRPLDHGRWQSGWRPLS